MNTHVRKRQKPALVSIVAPAFNEERNLPLLHREIEAALAPLDIQWELVLVDDGSSDNTWQQISELSERDPRIRGVRFSRNFGHQHAVFAGMVEAAGSVVITMDADLQHPPALLPALIDCWHDGYDIVRTIREDSDDTGFVKRFTSVAFYRLFSYLSGVEMQQGMADFRLLDRGALSQVLKFREEGLFLRGVVEWVGFRSTDVRYRAAERAHGTPAYTPLKMVRFAWYGISSFSIVPLRLIGLLGFAASALSVMFVLYAIAGWFLDDNTVPGWASTLAIMAFLLGLVFVYLTVLTEYILRIFLQVMGRPLYVVSERVGRADGREVTHPDRSADR